MKEKKRWKTPHIKEVDIGVACNKKFPQYLKCEQEGQPSEGVRCGGGRKPYTLT